MLFITFIIFTIICVVSPSLTSSFSFFLHQIQRFRPSPPSKPLISLPLSAFHQSLLSPSSSLFARFSLPRIALPQIFSTTLHLLHISTFLITNSANFRSGNLPTLKLRTCRQTDDASQTLMQNDNRHNYAAAQQPGTIQTSKHLLLTRWFPQWPCVRLGVGSWLQWSSVSRVCPPKTPQSLHSRTPPAADK